MPRAVRLVVVLLAGTALAAGIGYAQQVISAKSGLVHYAEGQVLLDGQSVEPKFGEFPEVKENKLLRTEAGRAEVLLTPGVLLRLAEDTSVRMVSNRLADTRLEFLEGDIMVEAVELLRDNAVTFAYRDATVELRKNGLYRLQSEPSRLRVYSGEALVIMGGEQVRVKGSRELLFGGVLAAEKFNNKLGDPFYRWGSRRSEAIALANLSASKSLWDQWGRSYHLSSSMWHWNPYFGMFTFIPYRGIFRSPFGFSYWSPREVYQVYEPPRRQAPSFGDVGGPRYGSGLGASVSSASRSAGVVTSGPGLSSSPAPSSAPAAGSSSRSSDGPRESGGGRGR